MRDALPILHRLVELNLDSMASDVSTLNTLDRQVLAEFSVPHTAWLFQVLQYLAATDAFTCTVWPGGNSGDSKWPPFNSEAEFIPLMPNGQKTHTKFTIEFGHALKALLPQAKLSEASVSLKKTLIARWFAAAALSAHLALSPQRPRGLIRLDTVNGEDEVSAHASVGALIKNFPPKLIQSLPAYFAAECAAFELCMNEIRLALATLTQSSQGRLKYEMTSRLVKLLVYCCCAQGLDGGKQKTGPRRLHQRACAFLVQEGFFVTEAQARAQLAAIGIGDAHPGLGQQRLPTKESEHTARSRGKPIYLEHLAKACDQRGILTPSLIDKWTRSPDLANALMAGYSNVTDTQPCRQDDEAREAADEKATGPGVSLNQDPEMP